MLPVSSNPIHLPVLLEVSHSLLFPKTSTSPLCFLPQLKTLTLIQKQSEHIFLQKVPGTGIVHALCLPSAPGKNLLLCTGSHSPLLLKNLASIIISTPPHHSPPFSNELLLKGKICHNISILEKPCLDPISLSAPAQF